MADGLEEREELQKRREREKRQDREDWLDRTGEDDWQPERTDS